MLKVSKELHMKEIPQSIQIYNPQQQYDNKPGMNKTRKSFELLKEPMPFM